MTSVALQTYSMERMTAMLFTFIEKNVRETFGQAGLAFLSKGLQQFGLKDTEIIAHKATSEGEIHTLFDYIPASINEPENYPDVTSFARFAKLFAQITKVIVDEYGIDGEKVIQKGVWDFGKKRGLGMQQRARARNQDNTIEHYLENYDMERSDLFVMHDTYHPNEIEQTFVVCPLGNQWAEDGMHLYGINYCKVIDNAIAYGYNNKFDVIHDEYVLHTGQCHFRFQMKDTEIKPKYD